ncbi:MAG: aminopeptidase P family protein [Bacilli bacterium]|nr:aminopeptidase P family protein [Bacilli bacterium]
MNIKDIQKYIALEKADAWVMVDYECHNPAMNALLGHKMLTRKIFMVIPAEGKPYLIAHTIDTVNLKDKETKKNFDVHVYKTWKEMLEIEKQDLSAYKKVLMDVSVNGSLPRVSLADWGSVEYVRSLGVEVISSQNVLQRLTAVYSENGYALQLEACAITLQIKDEAFRKIRELIEENGETNEYEIQGFIAKRFAEEGMVYDEPPLVAIGKNASDPHYSPTKDKYSPIKEGDLVLIDMWAKMNDPEAVYADITWMGYVGTKVPAKYVKRFEIVKNARDAVIEFLKKELPQREVMAYEADDVARKVIAEAGYGEYFVHRVGHNIAADVSPHGSGANLDNFETHDTRQLIEGTSFSDEPGIYAKDFGVRSETNLHIINGELEVVAGLQEEIIPIMDF